MTRFDAVIFDKDGTLFDFTATWAPYTTAAVRHLSGGDAALARTLAAALGFDMVNGRFDPASPVIAGTPEDAVQTLAPLLPDMAPEALECFLVDSAAAFPGVPATPLAPLLASLSAAGLLLGVVTNDAESAAIAQLDQAGITPAFAFVAGYDSGHGAKPAPGPLLAFCAATGTAPARTLMVGDSLHDLDAARAAGLTALGVLTGPAPHAVLRPWADAVLPDIGHLPAWLGLRPEND